MYVCMYIYIYYIYIHIHIHIHPGGWETALVVVNVLRKNCYGAVAPYPFL